MSEMLLAESPHLESPQLESPQLKSPQLKSENAKSISAASIATESAELQRSASDLAKISASTTPLMKQYWTVKSAHPDKIVLFRMGDFFEMFHRDAEIAAPVLGIALTFRNKKAKDETPMCGVPQHSVSGSINKLLAAGFKIAICDQLEDPKQAKGLVKRGITRVLTPGMVYDPESLDAAASHYLVSWDPTGSDHSVAFLDVSTGEGFYFLGLQDSQAQELAEALGAVEWVIPSVLSSATPVADSAADVWTRRAQRAGVTLSWHSRLELQSADGETLPQPAWLSAAPNSVQRVVAYAALQFSAPTAREWLRSLAELEARELRGRLRLSPTTLQHLEIFSTYKGETRGALFQAVDRTRTSAGARLLRSWLQFPLCSRQEIEARQDRVATWISKPMELDELRAALGGVGDLPRRLAKATGQGRGPRDLASLRASLGAAISAMELGQKGDESAARSWQVLEAEIRSVYEELERVMAEEPPQLLRQGGSIRAGASPELDELVVLATNSSRLVLELEQRERELTGISSLKIRWNNVFGYSIEITNTHRDRVPVGRYQRKQTLANAERFVTDELVELERKVVTAQDRRLNLEESIFQELARLVSAHARRITEFATVLAELDVLGALAILAREENYTRPKFGDQLAISLKASRHPVVEQLNSTPFIANDLEIRSGECLLLTGPNMAGKSTLMRQVAVTQILAQIGSFVPAREAHLPILERVLTRIGASDALAEGLSTFMVEMKETAELLAEADEKSLVVLDEIGRGTSTFDGMALAQAILEHLLSEKQCLTLFATHYHELTELETRFARLRNAHMAIHEKSAGEIVFLHRLVSGPATKSYGIAVARLAGLSPSITRRATQILKEVERSLSRDSQRPQLSLFDSAPPSPEALRAPESLGPGAGMDPVVEKVMAEMASLELERLTPLDAFLRLAEWRRELSSTKTNSKI